MAARQRWPTRATRLVIRLAVRALPAPSPAPFPASPATAPADPGSDPVTGYLTDLLTSTRDELNRADSKASLMLAAIGVIIGTLIGGITDSKWTPLSLGPFEQALWWAGVVAAIVGVFLISASVYPRTRQRATPASVLPAYYADVAAYTDLDAFRQAIAQAPDAAERLLNQTYVIARIVQAKYRQLQRGLLGILIAIIACTLAIVLNFLLT